MVGPRTWFNPTMHEFDLVIVGTGSGNSIPGPEFDDWNIAIVEKGVFGGTCLNVGCIPSKIFVYTADVAEHVRHAGQYGIDAQLNGVDWKAIRDRVFARIDPIAEGGERYRIGEECPNITVFKGEGRFVEGKVIEVAMHDGTTEQLTGRHVVLGAGARPFIPPYPGLDEVDFHTSDTIMRVDELPARLIVFGGGYIASELGHVFGGLGSHVTIVNRGERLLRNEDEEVSARFTEIADRRFDLKCGSTVNRVWQDDTGVHVSVTRHGADEQLDADVLLVATGRVPNGDLLDIERAGIEHDGFRVLVDEHFRTSVEGIWAFGDLSNVHQLKHLANAEVRALRHNLLVAEGQVDGPMETVDDRYVPHAVFGHPQVASVGLTEAQARAEGFPIVVANKDYGDVAAGWAMEDEEGFCKLVAHAETRLLLGAHIVGPHAASLLQQLVQGMEFGQTVDEMARKQFYTHPALSELVENCLLDL
jgi:mycothione reductase